MTSAPVKNQSGQPRLIVLLGLGLIVAATFVAYVPAMRAGFIWNDNTYVHKNALLAEPSLANLLKIWSLPEVRRADGLRYRAPNTEQYYPLVFTSFWLESHLWSNTSATGFHVVNIILHIASAVLIWLICNRLKLPWGFLVAMVFALHPVCVESVAWITERKNVLSTVFYLLAMLSYLRFGEDRRLLFYFAALGCFVLALLSKTVTCTLPVVLLLIFWAQQKTITVKKVAQLLPFFVLGISFGLLTAYLEHYSVGAVGAEWQIEFWQRCVLAGRAVFFYLGKLLWPARLVFIYPRANPAESSYVSLLWPGGVVLVPAVLWFWRGRFSRVPLVGWLAFIVTLFPALGFFDVYPFRYSFVADHFQYLACIYPLGVFVWLVNRLCKRLWPQQRGPANPPVIGLMLVTAVLLLLAGVTSIQARSYKDSKTLWQDTVRKNPQAWIGWNNLGSIYMQEKDFPTAEAQFRQAIKARADYAVAYANLGWSLAWQEKYDLAIDSLNSAIRLEPDYVWANLSLANVYAQRGRFDRAIPAYVKTIELAGDSVISVDLRDRRIEALSKLSAIYAELGQYSRAVEVAQQALDLADGYHLDDLARQIEANLKRYQARANQE